MTEEIKVISVKKKLSPGLRFMFGKNSKWWRILEVDEENNTMLVIAENNMRITTYNEDNKAVTWQKCTLRNWLNEVFVNEEFTDQEKTALAVSHLENMDNPEYGTKGGKGTDDRIFLLSIEEVQKYFKNNHDRSVPESSWDTSWWLRSPGKTSKLTAFVLTDGAVNVEGTPADFHTHCIRPAFRLDLKSEFLKPLITVEGEERLMSVPELLLKGSKLIRVSHSCESIEIPEEVTTIGERAFSYCRDLKSVTIPDTVQTIGEEAFMGCEGLMEVHVSDTLKNMLYHSFSYNEWPIGLAYLAEDVLQTDGSIFRRAFMKKTVWNAITPETQARIYLGSTRSLSEQSFEKVLGKKQINALAQGLIQIMRQVHSKEQLNRAADFLIKYHFDLKDEDTVRLFTMISGQSDSSSAISVMMHDAILREKLPDLVQKNEKTSEAEAAVMHMMNEENRTVIDLKDSLKAYCALDITKLPELKDKDGNVLGSTVLAWLLTKHDTVNSESKTLNKALYEKPGISDEAETIVSLLDKDSFMNAINMIASQCLGIDGYDRRMFAAFPICRYADAETMDVLTKRAPNWRSGRSGNEAPPLRTFRKACCYSNTKAAMMLADKFHDLDQYAKLRGMTAEELRDSVLSDVGLDENGNKIYDLGNQTVTVSLQKDLSYSITLNESGKVVKSIPKKGADPEIYDKVTEDFSRLKKDTKRIVKNRKDVLFAEFLEKTPKQADSWKSSYLKNPILREVASLLVWKQGKKTFTLGEQGPITSEGKSYTIGNGTIAVAHPMEISVNDLKQWQQYYTEHHLKQPFAQIWEPVIDPEQIRRDRYKGIPIPYFRFRGMEKHGIYVEDMDFHSYINITFDECDADVERLDWSRHEISNNDCFAVQSIGFKKYTRKVNHIIGYLDKVTVYGRVINDDVGVAEMLSQFTLAQITEYIKAAGENNCSNVMAVLLDYKDKNFGEYDPMDEFTLEL